MQLNGSLMCSTCQLVNVLARTAAGTTVAMLCVNESVNSNLVCTESFTQVIVVGGIQSIILSAEHEHEHKGWYRTIEYSLSSVGAMLLSTFVTFRTALLRKHLDISTLNCGKQSSSRQLDLTEPSHIKMKATIQYKHQPV